MLLEVYCDLDYCNWMFKKTLWRIFHCVFIEFRDINMNKRKISLSGLGPRRNKSGAAFVKLNEADDRRTTQLLRIV